MFNQKTKALKRKGVTIVNIIIYIILAGIVMAGIMSASGVFDTAKATKVYKFDNDIYQISSLRSNLVNPDEVLYFAEVRGTSPSFKATVTSPPVNYSTTTKSYKFYSEGDTSTKNEYTLTYGTNKGTLSVTPPGTGTLKITNSQEKGTLTDTEIPMREVNNGFFGLTDVGISGIETDILYGLLNARNLAIGGIIDEDKAKTDLLLGAMFGNTANYDATTGSFDRFIYMNPVDSQEMTDVTGYVSNLTDHTLYNLYVVTRTLKPKEYEEFYTTYIKGKLTVPGLDDGENLTEPMNEFFKDISKNLKDGTIVAIPKDKSARVYLSDSNYKILKLANVDQ